MLRVIAIILGCISFGASFLLLLVDLILRAIHSVLVFCSNRFLDDGEKLTGWGMKVYGEQ